MAAICSGVSLSLSVASRSAPAFSRTPRIAGSPFLCRVMQRRALTHIPRVRIGARVDQGTFMTAGYPFALDAACRRDTFSSSAFPWVDADVKTHGNAFQRGRFEILIGIPGLTTRRQIGVAARLDKKPDNFTIGVRPHGLV